MHRPGSGFALVHYTNSATALTKAKVDGGATTLALPPFCSIGGGSSSLANAASPPPSLGRFGFCFCCCFCSWFSAVLRVVHTAYVLLLLCLFLNTSCFLIKDAPEVRLFRPGSAENPPRRYGNYAPEVRLSLAVLLYRWKVAQLSHNERLSFSFAPEVR
jgi:hypothetical protein